MRYKIAIFDMDGTILNTLDDLCDSMNWTLRHHNLPERTLDEVRSFVGNGIHKLVERAVPAGSSEELVEEVFTTFNAYYKDHCAVKTRAYDGIPELVRSLRDLGVITAVVSNKADYGVQSLRRDYFDGLFDYAVGEKEGVRRKPNPDGVLDCIRKFGLTQADAVYIGDSDVDYATSVNAGVDVIMVGWGFRDEEFILSCGAPFVVHTPEEVLDIIKA